MTRKKPILQPTPKQHSIRARFSSASDRSFASINLYAYTNSYSYCLVLTSCFTYSQYTFPGNKSIFPFDQSLLPRILYLLELSNPTH